MDKYDEAIEFLTKNPTKIPEAWSFPNSADGGCLFKIVCHASNEFNDPCLTMIRNAERYSAPTKKLTIEIRRDKRIPKDPKDITIESLPVFAEWQRRLDKELERV